MVDFHGDLSWDRIRKKDTLNKQKYSKFIMATLRSPAKS